MAASPSPLGDAKYCRAEIPAVSVNAGNTQEFLVYRFCWEIKTEQFVTKNSG